MYFSLNSVDFILSVFECNIQQLLEELCFAVKYGVGLKVLKRNVGH